MGLGKNRHMDQWNRAESQETDHTSNLAWEIPWTEEPGALLSKGYQRVRHD